MNDRVVFRQSLVRLLFKTTLAYAVAFSLGYAIVYEQFRLENLLTLTLFTTAFYFFGRFFWYSFPLNSNPNLYTIEITDQQIIGPQSWQSIAVPVKEIDIAKSRQRGWIQTLVGRHRLRSIEGKGLFWFDDFVYGKGQFDRLLEIIGRLQNDATAQPQNS